MFVCLSKMFMCKLLISNMLHPKSGKSKTGEYEYTHKIAYAFRLSNVTKLMRLEGWTRKG
ncbi:hypothetical protein Hanom_Chr12g01085931 [Helianthus anomalus]